MGMLIVHKTLPSSPYFIASVMDWYNQGGNDFILSMPQAIESHGTGQYQHSFGTRRFDHANNEALSRDFESVLVNGRGRQAQNDKLPLERFRVKSGETYRFRMANTGSESGLEISIDSHNIQVKAMIIKLSSFQNNYAVDIISNNA